MNEIDIAYFIKLRMKQQKLSITELSRRAGVTTASITNYLEYGQNPRVDKVIRLIETLGYDIKIVGG